MPSCGSNWVLAQERFEERISKLVNDVTISLVARNKNGLIAGVLFGLTDYVYWSYITDLAVYPIANENAIPFYEKPGMKKANDVMQYNHIEWTEFTVMNVLSLQWMFYEIAECIAVDGFDQALNKYLAEYEKVGIRPKHFESMTELIESYNKVISEEI